MKHGLPLRTPSGAKRRRMPSSPSAAEHEPEVVSVHLRESRMDHASREQLIAEAAYHRAEARGFVPGQALDDWLAAEAEVDARLGGEGRAY